jgi:hypothetical protein
LPVSAFTDCHYRRTQRAPGILKLKDLEDLNEFLLKKQRMADYLIGYDPAFQITYNLMEVYDDLIAIAFKALRINRGSIDCHWRVQYSRTALGPSTLPPSIPFAHSTSWSVSCADPPMLPQKR